MGALGLPLDADHWTGRCSMAACERGDEGQSRVTNRLEFGRKRHTESKSEARTAGRWTVCVCASTVQWPVRNGRLRWKWKSGKDYDDEAIKWLRHWANSANSAAQLAPERTSGRCGEGALLRSGDCVRLPRVRTSGHSPATLFTFRPQTETH